MNPGNSPLYRLQSLQAFLPMLLQERIKDPPVPSDGLLKIFEKAVEWVKNDLVSEGRKTPRVFFRLCQWRHESGIFPFQE
jgi:hypothetical protein